MEPQDQRSSARRRAAVVVAGVLGLLALLGVIAALAAVIDIGPFEDDAPETLTEAEFIARGDRICERAHDQFAELQAEVPNSAEGAIALTHNLIEISENELDEMRALSAPPDAQEALDRYLEAREEGIDLLEQGLEAAKDGDAQAYAQAQAKIASGQLRRLNLARAVGFSECSVVQTG
jgi:hypothetical protein